MQSVLPAAILSVMAAERTLTPARHYLIRILAMPPGIPPVFIFAALWDGTRPHSPDLAEVEGLSMARLVRTRQC